MKNGDDNQRTKGSRGQQGEDDAVAWPVALENFALDQSLSSVWSQLLPNFLFSLSES